MELFSSSCCAHQNRNINEEEESLVLHVHFDLEDMRDVGNHGLPSELLALSSFA